MYLHLKPVKCEATCNRQIKTQTLDRVVPVKQHSSSEGADSSCAVWNA